MTVWNFGCRPLARVDASNEPQECDACGRSTRARWWDQTYNETVAYCVHCARIVTGKDPR